MTAPCEHTHLPEDWESLSDYIRRTNPVVAAMMWEIRHSKVCFETQRTVQVATRKYRSRKGRRK